MADRRKRSPAMRYIKRNGLYILIVCVLLLVVGAVIAVVGQVKRLLRCQIIIRLHHADADALQLRLLE